MSNRVQTSQSRFGYRLVMSTDAPVTTSEARESTTASPPCTHCASGETEPLVTMQRGTVDADRWYRCEECGHVFAESDGE
jgi:DNA-directed RNA polymerase subunit M/transcription elongation factor TFIIS